MRSTDGGCSISRCTSGRCVRAGRSRERLLAGEERAQATVEAALLVPVFLTVLLLALQPVCVLYTRAVMEASASAACRLMVTSGEPDAEGYRSFVLRRLSAVPDLSIFHAGGKLAWDIDLSCASGGAGEVAVAIEGAVEPLPVLGAFVPLVGEVNGAGDMVVRAEVRYAGAPAWLEGSYGTWTAVWD